MLKSCYALAAIIIMTVVSSATAQTTLERFERQLEQIQMDQRVQVNRDLPPEERVLVDYGAALSFGFLALDDAAQNTHILRQTSLSAYGRVDLDGVHQFFVRVNTNYKDWNSGDDFDGHGDDWVEPQLERATYTFDLKKYMARYEGQVIDWNMRLQGGRQRITWGTGLVLSEEIDGGQLTFSCPVAELAFVGGITRDSITDIDSSRPNFNGDTRRVFYGAKLAYAGSEKHRPFIYGLVQEDYNDRVARTVLIGGLPATHGFEYDSFYIGWGSTGRVTDQLLYSVEMAYEGGEGRSSAFTSVGGVLTPVAQTTEDIDAFGLNARLDYLVRDDNRTRITGEVVYASGDRDRLHTTNTIGGNRPGTDDKAFNAWGLTNTGLAFATNASNLLMFRGGVSTYPLADSETFGRLQVGGNLLVFYKANSAAPIDEPTLNRAFLGHEIDMFANWRVTSDLSASMRYGVFFPGEAITTDHDARHFFYTGLTLAF